MLPSLALEALQGSLLRDEETVAIADIAWERYAPVFALARSRPLIEDLEQARAALSAVDRPHEQDMGRELREQVLQTPPEDRRAMLVKVVRTEVARVLGHPTLDMVEPKRSFKDLGFDSLTAVELRNRLDALTGLALPATLAFDYPNAGVLSDYLVEQLVGEGSGEGSLEVELSKLEHTLGSLRDSAQRTGAAARLRVLLAHLESEDGAGPHNGKSLEEPAVHERMQVASDEEIFEFIDRELGSGRAQSSGQIQGSGQAHGSGHAQDTDLAQGTDMDKTSTGEAR